MKKLLLFALGLLLTSNCYAYTLISHDDLVVSSDLSLTWLNQAKNKSINALNAFDGGNIATGTVSPDAMNVDANPVNRWNEAFNDFIFTGLLAPTSATLTSTTTAGTAYIYGHRTVKDATSHTYTADKWTYVDLDMNGTYTYSETTIGATEPAVATNSIRLFRVSNDATKIDTVRDDRVMGITVGSTEDYYRVGYHISIITPDNITINPGVVIHGGTRITKTSAISLDLTTAADYTEGVSLRALSADAWVVVNNLGSIKMTTVTPDYSDVSGGQSGLMRCYSLVGTTYWRALNWFRMNGTGSGNLDTWDYGNLSDGNVVNQVHRRYSRQVTCATDLPLDATVPQVTEGDQIMAASIFPTKETNTLIIDISVLASGTAAADPLTIALFVEGNASAVAISFTASAGTGYIEPMYIRYIMPVGARTRKNFTVRGGAAAGGGDFVLNATGSGVYLFSDSTCSSITITEVEGYRQNVYY